MQPTALEVYTGVLMHGQACRPERLRSHLSATRVSWSLLRTHAQDTKAVDVGSDLAGNNESIEGGRLVLPCTWPVRCFVVARSRGSGHLRLSRDATPRVPIPALFVGVAMTVEHISSEVSVFAIKGKGDSTGGRARDLSLIMRSMICRRSSLAVRSDSANALSCCVDTGLFVPAF